jgi:hypothetical protein
MLGGTTSFVIFNIAGRGVVGVIVLSALSVYAFLQIQDRRHWVPIENGGYLIFGQLMGLSAISLAWEFPELLPIAIALFLGGFVEKKHLERIQWLTPIALAASLLILGVSFLARREFWWYVTDDYQFLEMLSQHITRSGPFADWGNQNFAKYHWLSYGWSGLLNELSGRPEVFTTLTRTVPFLYSLSLGSSVVLIIQKVISSPLTAKLLVPAWVVLSINILDWSGTSTAGVYAVNAALLAVAVTILTTSQRFVRRMTVYICFIPIVTLTKLASVFAVALVLLLVEVTVVTSQLTSRMQLAVSISALIVGMTGLIPILYVFGKATDGFSLSSVNPGLGQISSLGLPFTVSALVLWRLYLFVLLGLVLIVTIRRLRHHIIEKTALFLVVLSSFSFFGVLLDSIISGNSEGFSYGGSSRFMYFSGPMYFVASTSLLAVGRLSSMRDTRTSRVFLVLILGLTAAALVWGRFNLGTVVWQSLRPALGNSGDLKVSLLTFVTTDVRIGASLAAGFLCLIFYRKQGFAHILLSGTLFSIVILTFASYATSSLGEFRRERSASEIANNFGPPESQQVGSWIRKNSRSHELIATNFLFDPVTSQPLTDFSLAIWSEREFLILGPSFMPVFGDIAADVALSMSFGNNPTPSRAEALRNQGVQWFIVDRQVSLNVFSESKWNIQYQDERFMVIKL